MNAKSMNTASATAKIEGSKEARPPGGFPLVSEPKKIFICSPYRPTANVAPCRKVQLEAADEVWVFGETISEGMAAEIKRAHELKKPVCNLPEPGRMVELLLKRLSEQYHIPMEDKTKEQQEAAESEEDNGE